MDKKAPKKNKYKRTVNASAALICAALMLLIAAAASVGFAEWYSVHVYSLITRTVGRFFGAFPFSVSEVCVILLPVLLIADLIRCRSRLTAFLSHILLISSLLFFLYAANCGVNYRRSGFTDREALSEARFTEAQLVEFCEYAVSQIEESEPAGDEVFHYPGKKELSVSAVSSMHKLSETAPSLEGFFPAPKQLGVLSETFSAMGVSGIYSPFTVEANVNGRMPGLEKPFTSCHELSHLRGYMDEGEANYIGWLACIGSDDPAFRRSGWLIGWTYAGGALRRVDPEAYEKIKARVPEKAAAELMANSNYWASHETGASEIQDRVNDAYLKTNGLSDGVQSYGMLTVLMLMWYFDQ